MLYNQHIGMGSLPGETVKDSDALILEYVADYNTEEKVKGILSRIQGMRRLYSEILQEAVINKKPVFLVDLQYMTLKLDILIPALECFLGYSLANFAVQEFRIKPRVKDRGDYKTGDKITVEVFKSGEPVNVRGISKGKGFQGVVKRHGFHGGPKSHGQKHRLRAPGSIGWTALQRVAKGRKMAGRMGGDFVTVKNLKIAKVDQENNLIFIKGAVPGNLGGLLKIFSEK